MSSAFQSTYGDLKPVTNINLLPQNQSPKQLQFVSQNGSYFLMEHYQGQVLGKSSHFPAIPDSPDLAWAMRWFMTKTVS